MELISSKRSCRTFFLINIQEDNEGNFIKMFPSPTDAVTVGASLEWYLV